MTKSFTDLMRQATSLVADRRLDEATAAIQAALGGKTAKPGPAAGRHDGPTLELRPERADAPGPSASASPLAALGQRLAPILATRPRFPAPSARRDPAPLGVPAGASFAHHVHSGPAGSRAYKLYRPAHLPAGPRPLVLMLHGCTQNPDDFARGTRMNALAEERGFLVAYPEQPQSANAQRCWNWFDPAHQQSGRGEPAILMGIVEEIAAANAVDEARVFVAGLSAGGAMAAVLCATYPDRFAGVGVHSGLSHGSASDVSSALGVMRSGKVAAAARRGGTAPRLIVFHGDGDRTVHPANGEAVAGLGPTNGATDRTERGTVGGRGYAKLVRADASGRPAVEHWRVEGLGHAWSGGDAGGSYADPLGPDASREMIRFFLDGAGRD